jgi:hypothetical protein
MRKLEATLVYPREESVVPINGSEPRRKVFQVAVIMGCNMFGFYGRQHHCVCRQLIKSSSLSAAGPTTIHNLGYTGGAV